MRPSLQSQIMTRILKVLNFKKRVEKRVLKPIPRSKKGFVPRRLERNYRVRLQTFENREIATFEHKEKSSQEHIIFFHGGAYVFEATPNHWRFAEKIVNKSFCRMTLVDYPLAPEHSYRDTFKMISGAYDLLARHYPDDKLMMMGDSSGGGLALALTQKLILENHNSLPAGIILLSPWLDLTLSNPGIKELERSDCILSVKMLRDAGMLYSNGDQQDQYLLSPIYGELEKIPRTLVFFGSEELFKADCVKFKSMLASKGPAFIFREYPGMQHDWALFPIPESTQLVDELCAFIKE